MPVAAMAGKMRGQSEETGDEIGYLRRSIEELKEFFLPEMKA